MRRIYVPATTEMLRRLVADGRLPAEVSRIETEDDDEESEYAGLTDAADASAELLEAPGRRVVVVAEVPDPAGPVAMAHVVAVHADASDDWRPDDDLGWYATQEIEHLLAG